jgi:hypothetical protein
MKHTGCSILFVNPRNQVLLFLRDDKPDIHFPGTPFVLDLHTVFHHTDPAIHDGRRSFQNDGEEFDRARRARSVKEPLYDSYPQGSTG